VLSEAGRRARAKEKNFLIVCPWRKVRKEEYSWQILRYAWSQMS
jgi:hypothetical protein